MIKICGICHTWKPYGEFGKRKTSIDGMDYVCRVCKRSESRNTWDRHRSRFNKEKAEKRKHPEVKAKRSAYGKKVWRAMTIEQKNQYYARNRLWQQSRPGIVAHYCQTRRHRNNGVENIYSIADRKATERIFGNRCANCEGVLSLQIDHHYSLSCGFGLTVDNAVLLCKSCNSSKGAKKPTEFYTKETLAKIEYILAISSGPM